MNNPNPKIVYWSSPGVFVLAAAGVATGLGSVWRLPALAGEYGGGAFVLIYVAALVGMCLPVLAAQLMLGRGVRGDIATCIRGWAQSSGQHPLWRVMAYLALAGAVAVLSYYSVIAGWSLAYLMRSAGGAFEQLGNDGIRESFLALVDDPEKGLGWHTIFIVATVICAAHGVRRGLERTTLIAFVFAALALLLLLAIVAGDGQMRAAAHYLLRPDFAALGWRGALEALHQAFFSLSLGVGVMIAFGAYLRDGTSIFRVSLAVIGLNLVFTLLAGWVVMAMLLGADIQPSPGLKLIFENVPAAASANGGGWALTLFFLVLLLVTLTTAVGLMEPIVVWLRTRLGISRIYAVTSTGLGIWFLGLGTLLSFNLLADATLLDRTLFEWLSLVSSRFVLPLVGLLTCVFVGRFLPADRLTLAWSAEGRLRGFGTWRLALRYPARVGLILVLLYSTGVFTLVDQVW